MSYYVQWKTLKFMLTFFILTNGVTLAMDQSEPTITLNNIKMNVIKTAENGVVNHETIFHFLQKDGLVSAEYQGGKILKGFLVGTLSTQNQLEFSYCQMQLDGKLDNGASICQLSKNLFKILESPRFEFFSPRKQHKNLVNINQYNPGFCAASCVENNFKYGHSKILNRF